MITSPGSLQSRIFWAFTIVTVIAVTLPALYTRNAYYHDRVKLAAEQALVQAEFVHNLLDAQPSDEQMQRIFNASAGLGFRMTLTSKEGRVLRDSHIGADALPDLDNHGDRPEIEDARTKGTGISLRHSNSLGIDAVYAAAASADGSTLRVAVPLAEIERSLESELFSLTAAVVAVTLFCLFLAWIISRRVRMGMDSMAEVVAFISRDKNMRRLHEVPGKEFLPLAHAVNHMADTIEASIRITRDQHNQLETILDSMHEGVLVLGPSKKIRRWNRALCRLFPSIAKAEGKDLIEALPVPALQCLVDELFQQGSKLPASIEDRTSEEIEPIHFELPSGKHLIGHVSLPATQNDSLGAVIVIYDATEIMRLETVRRDFVSNVSHELRTPLTAITGYAETLMHSGDLKQEYRKFAGVIHKHATALAGIITDLLALARIENEREAFVLTSVDSAPIIAEAMEYCSDQATGKKLVINLELEEAPVRANKALLLQVFRNLLENAYRYSPENGTVCITSKREGDKVLFTVSDNGPGIPQEDLSRIFERFYQVKKERNSGASGIGLALCKHIVERHKGHIWAESPYRDAATAMVFSLPVAQES